MVDHRRRVENAIRIAKEIHGKRKREVLLQDQYPTSYMPHVGRQVMQSGGTPEDVAINPFADIVLPPEEKNEGPRDYRQPLGERVREGISKGFGEQRLGLKLEEQQRYDPTGIIQNMVAVPLDFTLRAPGAVIGGLAGLGAGLYGKLPGVDETQTNKMQRDLKVLGDVVGMEAGNVRPRAPSDVSSIPRSGELLPPNPPMAIPRALDIAREVRERPPINPDGTPSVPQPPLPTVREPTAPVREPTATVQAPVENIDMSRRNFLKGSAAAAGAAALPKGTLPALLNEPKPAVTAMDMSRATPILDEIFSRPVPLDHPAVVQYADPNRLSYEMDYSPYREGGGQSLSTWELANPERSNQLYNAIATSHPQGVEGAKVAAGELSKPFLEEARKELEAKLGHAVTDEEFSNLADSIARRQQTINDLRHNAYEVSVEGIDINTLNDLVLDYARVAGKLSGEPPPRTFDRVWGNIFEQATPEAVLEYQYGIPRESVAKALDDPFVVDGWGDNPPTMTLREYFDYVNDQANEVWWSEANAADKRTLKNAWNEGASEVRTSRTIKEAPVEAPVREVAPPVEQPSLPKSIDELRQIQAQAKQAFEEAKVAVQADRTNPELKAQIAQRQKELMAATKEVEKAESAREPKPGATSNAPREPEYVPPRSEMGLYSYAAEVAAKARQAGKPEDLIAWLKAQPGVKLEELREAGAVRADGSYNPSFAPDVKKMTPNELAERLNAGVPEVRDFVRYEKRFVPVSGIEEMKKLLIKHPNTWYNYLAPTERDWHSFADDAERMQYLNQNDEMLGNLLRYAGGELRIPGGTKYGPNERPNFNTSGGMNYREIPLSLTPYDETPPTRIVVNGPFYSGTFATMDDAKKHMDGIRERAMQVFGDDPAQLEVTLRDINRTEIHEEIDPSFKSRNIMNYGHMKDVPNNLAWLRVQDFAATKPGGEALRVEETQSDISQKGREIGFRMSADELKQFEKEHYDRVQEYDDTGKQFTEAYSRWIEENQSEDSFGKLNEREFIASNPKYKQMSDRLNELEYQISEDDSRIRKNDTALPRLPYMEETQQWTDLTTKRALIEAARGGYTELQFITGDINRKRYRTYEEGDAGYHYDVNIPSSLKRVLKTIDPDAKVERIKVKTKLTPVERDRKEYFESIIEKSTRKIRDLKEEINNYTPGSLKYRDFEEALQYYKAALGEYEQQLLGLTGPKEFWSVEITPKMREKIKEGLPRFAIGGAITHMTVEEFAEALEE